MLTNRIAWVTGAGRGIGESVARVLSREGAQVACSDLDQESCQKVVSSLNNPDLHLAVKNDVSNKDSVKETFEAIKSKYAKPPDIIVNSAGITMDKYLLRMSEDSFDKVINVNLKGTFLVNQIAASAMKEADIKGSIVNISSIVAKTGNVGQANYSPSKAGVIAFTKTAAKELGKSNFNIRLSILNNFKCKLIMFLHLGKFGIRVNCICPGFIQTAMVSFIRTKVNFCYFFLYFGQFFRQINQLV